MVGADIFVQGFVGNVYLHEIPLANYLDEQKALDNAVIDYSFFGFDIHHLCEFRQCTFLGQKSSTSTKSSSNFFIQINSVDDNFLETNDQRFYKPTEIKNSTSYTSEEGYWNKPDAVKALYAYEP